MNKALKLLRDDPERGAAVLIASLVAIRLIAVMATPLNLGPDEAQYWRWGQHLDWGYYSKPPLIAWTIALSTSIFGDSEWAVRFFAPLTHGVAAWFLFLLGKRAYGLKTGCWAAATYMLMPGVWLSSGIISTDGLLLPCWAAGLYCLWRMREGGGWASAAGLGAAIGAGFLAKYAMLYFLAGLALAAFADVQTRRSLLTAKPLATLIVAAALIAPNILWNAANDFATVSHTADNTDWENAGLNFDHLLTFLIDQLGVFGPFSLLILLGGLAFILPATDADNKRKDIWLLCFILPPLIAIGVQSVVSRAHANWAATAYPAASVLVAAWALRANWKAFLKVGLALQLGLGALFLLITLNLGVGDAIGASNAYKRARGWEQSVAALTEAAQEAGANGVVFDERENFHGLDYYGFRAGRAPAPYLWNRYNEPHSFAEAHAPPPMSDETVLVAARRSDFIPRIRADYREFEPAGRIDIPLGPTRKRVFCLYRASGYAPLTRDQAYEKEFATKRETCAPS